MATTTPNFGWTVPTSTDLVKNGATAIETLGDGIDASFVGLKGGTTGQVLSKTSATDLAFTWVAQDDSNAIQNAIVDAKGDLIAATANDTPARLAVGTNGQILTADSTASTGLAWATAATGALTLINTTSFSAVASQSINDVFSATYNSYKIVTNLTGSVSDNFNIRLRVGGVDNSSANYSNQRFTFSGTSSSFGRLNSQTSWNNIGYVDGTSTDISIIELLNPFATMNTSGYILGLIDSSSNTAMEFRGYGLGLNVTTSYTGFTIFPSSGTITGSISVYGYNK